MGQLRWIASQSRPDLCFDVLDLATICDVSDMKLKSKINKVGEEWEDMPSIMVFEKIS